MITALRLYNAKRQIRPSQEETRLAAHRVDTLITFLKDTPTHKVLYAIDANEEAESYFGLYLITDSAGTTFSKLLFMAKSVEQLQEAAEALSGTNAQEGTLRLPQGRK